MSRAVVAVQVEIPVLLALLLKRFELELLDPLPGMDFKSVSAAHRTPSMPAMFCVRGMGL